VKIDIQVKTGSKETKVVKIDSGLKVYLTSKPIKGKANEQLIEVLSDYFSISKSKIFLDKGGKSKSKRVIIDE
jgi:hypothetical protein